MKNPLCLLTILLWLTVASCGKSDSFRLDAAVSGLGSEEVEMIYIDPASGAQRVTARADAEGRFRLEGSSAEPVIVSVCRSNGEPLFDFIAANGDRIKASMTLGQPATLAMEGTDANKEFAVFVAAHADLASTSGRAVSLNRAVAAHVRANKDKLSSAAVLVTLYDASIDPAGADSLLNQIAVSARPSSVTTPFRNLLAQAVDPYAGETVRPLTFVGANDSLSGFVATTRPYAILAFTAPHKPDSVRRMLRELRRDYSRRRLDIVELALWGDSASWRADIRPDSATWSQGWVVGGAASYGLRRLNIPRTPFFILTDSTGIQRLRTSSVRAVRAALKELPNL